MEVSRFRRLPVSMVLVASLILILVIAGCSTKDSGSNSGSIDQADNTPKAPPIITMPKAPPKITMMNTVYGEAPPKDDDQLMSALQEITGVDLEVTWVPSNVYLERFNVTMASGEMPQILIFESNPYVNIILEGIRSGMFWELDPYLNEFPNLTTYHPLIEDNARVDGKLYMIPRPSPLTRGGTVIREDWLANVGMQAPKTIEEFYNLAVAFKEKDPDQNGVDDTYGLMLYEGQLPSAIFAAFGAPNNWKVENGQFIKDVETPEYLKALKFFKKMYQEGLINPEFPVASRNEARNDLYNSKVGLSIEAIDALIPYYPQQMEKAGLKAASFVAGPPLEGITYGGTGMYGGALIPKSSVKTEEELKVILGYFNTLRDPKHEETLMKVWEDMLSGPPETRSSIEGLEKNLIGDRMMYARPGTVGAEALSARLKEYADAAIPNPAYGLTSPTQIEKGAQLNTILKDASIQFVLDKIDEVGFATAVERWKNTGGNQVAQELAKLYKDK